jgi:sec-independent protein translocase protein TatB
VFDIGFTELLVCLVVALVVIGPEQLPATVRTVGLWIGRLKRSLRDTRQEIERQIGADDIRRQLHNEEVMQNLEEARLRIEKTMREAEEAANLNAAQQAPSAKDYGPPDELPNHAHEAEAVVPATSSSTTANQPATQPTTTAQPQSGTGH